MALDRREAMLQAAVVDCLSSEHAVAAVLDRVREVVRADAAAAAAVDRIDAGMPGRREALEQVLTPVVSGGDQGHAPEPWVSAGGGGEGQLPVSGALRDLAAVCQGAVGAYAMLHAAAMRLFEPPLRELAPRHLRVYVEAVQSFTGLLPGVTARELARDGLDCACTCPMCSVGACGCVTVAAEALDAAWRETVPSPDARVGFVLQRPRPGSQLARAGVAVGDRLLAVDNAPVVSFRDVQAGLRAHQPGEEIHLRLERDGEAPREVVVTRADTWPYQLGMDRRRGMPAAGPAALPRPPTPLVGREAELAGGSTPRSRLDESGARWSASSPPSSARLSTGAAAPLCLPVGIAKVPGKQVPRDC